MKVNEGKKNKKNCSKPTVFPLFPSGPIKANQGINI
jgi:hypothetical protein